VKAFDYSKLLTCRRVIIDGDPGAGKTTLANQMANDLGFKVISFDDSKYLPGDGRLYLEQLNYDVLKNDILSCGSKIIIEGLFALKVLGKICVSYDYHIFMKLFNGICGWEYEYYLGEKSKIPKSKLTKEVVQYYKDYRPFDVCNLVLSRELTSQLKAG
jgi:hypothetical protein